MVQIMNDGDGWRRAMARNMVQFQKGLSEPAFEQQYGTEEQCRAIVIELRWPDGFECPACGGHAHSLVKTRGLFQCSTCRRQTSPIAGTIFAATKLPLRIWFPRHVPHDSDQAGDFQHRAWPASRREPAHRLENQAQTQTSHDGARCHQETDRAYRD